ncbi:MAG: SlyX protein [Woeseiaceae bacterium]|jgi:SlyX protein|tara:strand:+ start:2480 stop:2686 length:207 start_codon:yes stop_codon:yes gene_type:complete
MADDQLINIETKLSYQENLLDQLNSIIIKQQEELDILKRALLSIQERVTILNESSSEIADSDERPPHY